VIEAGIRRVVIGQLDPNPIAGGGVQVLKNAGIEVVTGVLEPQARELNEVFNKYITTGRPFVILKSAATLDGKTASHTGHSRWVTGEKARQYVHRLRNQVDAILVGRGTVLADDPTLNTRLAGKKSVRHPLRVVLDTGLTLPLSTRVFQPDLGGRTIVVSGPDPDPERMTRLEGLGVAVWPIPLHQGRIDLSLLMDRLGREQVTSVLIEGGADVAASALLIHRIVDKILYFFAPKIIGGRLAPPLVGDPGLETMDQALNLDIQKVRRLGMDWLFEAVPRPAV
jgi:diaminohydroxyphosphoribosylaminopyrimidine deaminase/5-amino-6-(5-phosphoribosylamino)uracil reductase